jgi:predicted alpha/beta superfamily hydrolase
MTMSLARMTRFVLLGGFVLVGAACRPDSPFTAGKDAAEGGLSETRFFDPPLSARPSVLWAWLNGFVDRDQLTRELEEMKAKGLGGAVIWDVGSLRDPRKIIPAGPAFLGPESVASISHAIDEAGRLGLELGLFASSSWNAGGAWITPENASQRLLCRLLTVQGPGRVKATVPLPEGVTARWRDVAVVAVPPGGPPVDISGRLDGEGRLDWDAPAGETRIMRFVASNTGQTLECPSPNSDGLIIDHLSREAATVDMTYILDRLLSERKGLDALKTFMLDSYEVAEAVDWTDGFVEAFRTRHGYDPVPYLPALFDPAALDPGIAGRFLYDYRKTVSDLIIDNHFRAVRDLLNERGVRLLAEAGHGGSARVDALKALGSADVPMGEFWNHKQFWVVKEAASAAHIYGRRIVDAEALTGWRNWQDGPAEYKRRFDIALCAGMNHPTFHTFAHNPPAAGRPGFVYHAGEHFNVNTTWWDQAGPLIEYMARCGYLLQQGLFVADVAFYYGDQAPNLVPARRIDPDIEPLYPETDCLHCGKPKPIQTTSLDRGYDYDYVNSEVVLERMRVSDGRIVLSDGLSYALLVLPDREDMPLEVLGKLGELAEAGATIVGRKPLRAPGLAGFPGRDEEVRALADGIWGNCDGVTVKEHRHGKGRIVWGTPLNEVLSDRGLGPDFRALAISNADQHIDFIHRSTGRDDVYFVSNSAKAGETFDAVFRVERDRTPEFWNPDSGTIVPCRSYARVEGGCRLTLELPAYGSVFIVFREKPTPAAFLSPEPLKAGSLPAVQVDGPWTLRFPPDRGAPGSVEWTDLIDWTRSDDPGIRYFSGTASYSTEFEIGQNVWRESGGFLLDLGQLREVAEVTVNGRGLGILWKEPFQVDVSGALRPGRNSLEVKVTNLWHNRLMGDLVGPGPKRYTRTNMTLKAQDLIPAGLLGPVKVYRASAPSAQAAAGGPIPHRIPSEALKEERVVTVFLPDSYEATEERYPVLVVLDGEDFARPIAGMISYYAKIGRCPETIVAGIESRDRWRDYTPTRADIPDGTPLPTSGGARSFTRFLANECLPYLASKYRTSPFHVLYGHSIAGLYVVSESLDGGSPFSGFVATSPSLWWDHEMMAAKAAASAGPDALRSRDLFLTMGNEGPTMLDPLRNFVDVLREVRRPGLRWEFRPFEDVDHQTMPMKAFAYALEYVFGDWPMPQNLYEEGLPAVVAYYEGLSARYLQKVPPPKNTINRLGYMALNRGELDEALKIFQFNIDSYPRSANVYDSMGEACLKAGDSKNALKNYRMALKLDPDNDKLREIVKRLEAAERTGKRRPAGESGAPVAIA